MSAQIGDEFKFDGNDYTIVAKSAPIMFNPRDYGITPKSRCTACWSGYWCVYNIKQDGIYLEDLYINSSDNNYPEILGVKPEPEKEQTVKITSDVTSAEKKRLTKIIKEINRPYFGHHLYKGINIKMPYTGKILVGNGFISNYYIHMGYQRPWAYKNLIELVFVDGELVEKNDQSEIAKYLRGKIEQGEIEYERKGNGKKFVDECFSLDYDIKAWWLV